MKDIDLDVKLESDKIIEQGEGSLVYMRFDDNEVNFVYAGTDEEIIFGLLTAMFKDEEGVLYDNLSTAVAVYEEQYGSDTE